MKISNFTLRKSLAKRAFQISNFISHPLFAGSLVMVVGSNIFNVVQFAYHFIAGRMLGKVYYGDLAAIISIIGIIGIIQTSVGLTIIKFIAHQKSSKETANFIKWVNWWSIWVGVGAALLTLIASPLLIKFLNVTQPFSIYFLVPILVFFIILNNQRSILQALLRFDRYVLSLLIEGLIKIPLTILLIFWGFAAFGAIIGLFFGFLSAFLLTRFSLASYLKGKREEKPEIAPLFKYSAPVFVQGLALTSMYTADLLLVKHFFTPDQAGIYASLAVLGRVALFGTTPIIQTMFPLIVQRFAKNKPYYGIFYLSVLLVFGISVSVIALYLFFPKIPIEILYGRSYLEGIPFLWWFGVFMGLLSISMLFTQFYLSIGKTRIVSLFAIAAISQIILIWFFHSNILTVIQVSIICAALLVLSLLVYFPYHRR